MTHKTFSDKMPTPTEWTTQWLKNGKNSIVLNHRISARPSERVSFKSIPFKLCKHPTPEQETKYIIKISTKRLAVGKFPKSKDLIGRLMKAQGTTTCPIKDVMGSRGCHHQSQKMYRRYWKRPNCMKIETNLAPSLHNNNK